MAIITSTNVASAVTKLVAVDALPALVGNLVMGNLVRADFDPVVFQPGDVATLWTFDKDVPVVLNSHAEATFQIPDVTKVLAVPELLQLYMHAAMAELGEKIESDLLATCSQFTANAPVGAAGVSLTEASVDSAETALFQARVPASSPKYLVVDGNAYSALRQIPRFSEYRTAGEAGVRTLIDGFVQVRGGWCPIGRLKDFFVFRSQFVAKTSSAPATTYNMAFAKDAIGLVTRRLPQPLPGTGAIAEYAEFGNFGMRVIMNYQPNTLAQQFTVDVLYGVAVLRNSFGVQVLS